MSSQVAKGSQAWIAHVAKIFTEELVGIEIQGSTNLSQPKLVFVLTKEPRRDQKTGLGKTQLRTRKMRGCTLWELIFLFTVNDCPNAAALITAANEQILEVPPNVMFSQHFFGMYKDGIRPNVNANAFVFSA